MIIKNKWYLMGRWVEPVLAGSFWVTFQSANLGIDFFSKIRSIDNYYFLLQDEMDKMEEFVKDKIDNDIGWFDNFFNLSEKYVQNILEYKDKKDLSSVLMFAKGFCDHFMTIFFLDYGILKYIEKLEAKTGVVAQEVSAQIKPYRKTPLMKYHEDLKVLNKDEILEFVKKYEWVGTHLFMNNPLSEEKVKKELSEIPDTELDRKYIELPGDYKNIIEIGSKLAFYRSYMIETFDSVMFEYWADIKKIGEKHGLKWDEILLLTHGELIILNDNGVLPNNFKDRAKGFGEVYENGKVFIVTGEKLKERLNECQEKIENDIIELKGMVACKGKIMQGVIKVVEEAKYISKINKGDILVANETTPDYVVGMKVAGAIITNQGGITSHAAITSREMNIPCVIGTKIATKVLKDGDLVEVDANNGIVKIIKRV